MYTFLFTLEQLERCHDMQDTGILRIVHVLLDDSEFVSNCAYSDRYITLIDCSPQQATLLHLI